MPDLDRGTALVAQSVARLESARAELVLRLARAVSLAVIVESGLLRRARLQLVPGADAGIESDLWFSPLVWTRNPSAIVLDPDALEALRSQLASDEATRARSLVTELHASHPSTLRLEEDLVWQAIRHRSGLEPMSVIEEGVREAIRGMVHHEDGGRGVASWADQAMLRLPEVVRSTSSAQELAAGAALRVRRRLSPRGDEPVPLPASLAWLAPSDLQMYDVRVEAADGALRFVEADDDQPALTLPRTSPLMVELRWQVEGEECMRLHTIELGEPIELDGLAGPVTVRTLAGRRYEVQPEFEPGTGGSRAVAIDQDAAARLASVCVSIRSAHPDFDVVAIGYRVADDLIATSDILPAQHPLVLMGGEGAVVTAVLERESILLLRLDPPRKASQLVPDVSATLAEGATWTSWSQFAEIPQGGAVSGTIRGGVCELPVDAWPTPTQGAPVLVDGQLVGQVRAVTADGTLELVPVAAIVGAIRDAPAVVGIDIVVTHGSVDLPWAEWVAYQAQRAGLRTELVPAGRYGTAEPSAIRSARRVVPVLSSAYVMDATRDEWDAMIADEQLRDVRPVRIDDVPPPAWLAGLRPIDLAGLDEAAAQAAMRTLVADLPPYLDPPAQGARPPFPGGDMASDRAGTIFDAPSPSAPFVGRDLELARLHDEFARDNLEGMTRVVAIVGMGGVGKTQLAARFARAWRDDYDIVWWVNADLPLRIESDLARLADRLGLAATDEAAAATAARQWLQGHGRWLLVFDDAPSSEDIANWLPVGTAGGHVLITTRAHGTALALDATLALQALERSASVELLTELTGEHDVDALGEVADALGGLPLALVVAGSAVRQGAISLSEYARVLASTSSELAGGRGGLGGIAGQAVTLAIERAVASPPAGELLEICAYLADEGIPRDLLTDETVDVFGDAFEPSATARAVDLLVDSILLLSQADDTVIMHRLIRQGARAYFAPRSDGARAAERLLAAAFPANGTDVDSWPRCEQLLSHAQAVTERAPDSRSSDSLDTVVILTRMGRYLRASADITLATRALSRAVDIAEQSEDSLSEVLIELGLAQREAGATLAALQTMERALAVGEHLARPGHLAVARHIRAIGMAQLDMGDVESARSSLERALVMIEHEQGPDDPDLASALADLGVVYGRQGELELAHTTQQRAFDIRRAIYRSDHPFIAEILTNLGDVLTRMGDIAAARDALAQALEINEAAYGAHHPEVARTLMGIGIVLAALGEPTDALAAQQRALAIYESIYGPEHPMVGVALENLATALDLLAREDEAREARRRRGMIMKSRGFA